MLKQVPVELLEFCIEPRTATELWGFCRERYGLYKRTPRDPAVSLFKQRYLQSWVGMKLIFQYDWNDSFFEKVRQYLVLKRKECKKGVPRKLYTIYQTNILYPLTLYFQYSDFPQELKEINFDMSIIFWKIFALKEREYNFFDILNLILTYSEDRDQTRFLLYNLLEEEKAELIDKFLNMCKKIPKDLNLPFNSNPKRVQEFITVLAES